MTSFILGLIFLQEYNIVWHKFIFQLNFAYCLREPSSNYDFICQRGVISLAKWDCLRMKWKDL